MKQTRDIMGMPVSVEITDLSVAQKSFDAVFDYFISVDEKFSTYKNTSEISRINRGEISVGAYSNDMNTIFALSEETKQLTNGYFDIRNPQGVYDPSGLVKGWAIKHAGELLRNLGHKNFYIDAGGDIETHGKNSRAKEWSIGIRNPFNKEEIVKIISPRGKGVATSGTYLRGEHIYNPHDRQPAKTDIVSFTVIGPNIYEADRFATAAFAMGPRGIEFIEKLEGFEGYAINKNGIAVMTSGFDAYTIYNEHNR